MNKIIKGKTYVLGDNIDTDQIIPAEYLIYSITDPEESKIYGKHALSSVPPANAGLPIGNIPFVKQDEFLSEFSIIIAGSNFGCGSSREHAPFALQKAGVSAVISQSYARIFYRNAIDGGFIIPLESISKLNDKIKTGDELEINLDSGILKNFSDGAEYSTNSLGEAFSIVEAGGLFEYARKNNMI